MIGDGSFQLTAQEVSTMIRNETRPIIVLVNNHGYIIEDAIHEGPYNRIKNWDYAGLMAVLTNDEGAGLGLRAKTAGELAAALKTALGHAGPCLIEVDIDPRLQPDAARVGYPRRGGQRCTTSSVIDYRCGALTAGGQ